MVQVFFGQRYVLSFVRIGPASRTPEMVLCQVKGTRPHCARGLFDHSHLINHVV